MNYTEAEDIVCDGIAKFCEALLENGFTVVQMELVDREICQSTLFDQLVEILLTARQEE